MGLQGLHEGAQDIWSKGELDPRLTARALRTRLRRHRMQEEMKGEIYMMVNHKKLT